MRHTLVLMHFWIVTTSAVLGLNDFDTLFPRPQPSAPGTIGDMVGFAYYTKESPIHPVDPSTLPITDDGAKMKTLVYVHGWNGNMQDSIELKDAVLAKRSDVGTVILVDWVLLSQGVLLDYYEAAIKNVPHVATALYIELENLHGQRKIAPSDLIMVGFSLGSHIVGQTGKHWNKKGIDKIAEMIGLDPARPYFETNLDKSLMKGDAAYVEIIHTSPDLGIYFNLGDQDFYLDQSEIDSFGSCSLKSRWNFDKRRCDHSSSRLRFRENPQSHIGTNRTNSKPPTDVPGRTSKSASSRVTINMLVLDVSPSMHENGKARMKSLVTSSQRFVGSVRLGTYLGVVIFGGNGHVSHPCVNVSTEVVRRGISDSLPNLNSKIDYTSIGAGLRAAVQAVSGVVHSFPGSCPNMIVITDGEENSRPYIADVMPEVTNLCSRVNSIALGPDADKNLESLSSKTGGLMLSVSDLEGPGGTMDKLTQNLHDAQNNVLEPNERPINLPTQRVRINSSILSKFLIDPQIGRDTKFFISHPQFDKLEAKLFGPDKSEHVPQVNSLLQGIEFNIPEATSGVWSLSLSPNSTNGRRKRSLDEAIATVTTYPLTPNETAIRLDAYLNSSVFEYGKDIVILKAQVSKGDDAVVGANVTAFITSPAGNTVTLTLLDNGVGADEEMFDGIYSRYITHLYGQENERHEIVVRAVNLEDIARIRPYADLDFTFMSDRRKELEVSKYKKVYSFERQVSAGSIRVLGKYKKPNPCKVNDLRVTQVDKMGKSIRLVWTAAGDEGDNGTAAFVHISATTNLFDEPNQGILFNDSNILNGSLKPLPAGQLQNVSLQIPHDLWDRATNNSQESLIQLYFTIRTFNNESGVGEVSNVAPAALATSADEVVDNEESNSSNVLGPVLIGLGGLVAIVIGVVGIFRWRHRRTYRR